MAIGVLPLGFGQLTVRGPSAGGPASVSHQPGQLAGALRPGPR